MNAVPITGAPVAQCAIFTNHPFFDEIHCGRLAGVFVNQN
jgi:hypothetical protein